MWRSFLIQMYEQIYGKRNKLMYNCGNKLIVEVESMDVKIVAYTLDTLRTDLKAFIFYSRKERCYPSQR